MQRLVFRYCNINLFYRTSKIFILKIVVLLLTSYLLIFNNLFSYFDNPLNFKILKCKLPYDNKAYVILVLYHDKLCFIVCNLISKAKINIKCWWLSMIDHKAYICTHNIWLASYVLLWTLKSSNFLPKHTYIA